MRDVCAVLKSGSSVAGRAAIDSVVVTPEGGAGETIPVEKIAWILFDAGSPGAVEVVLAEDRRRLVGRLGEEMFTVESADGKSRTIIFADSLLALWFGGLETGVLTFKVPMTASTKSTLDLCSRSPADITLVDEDSLSLKPVSSRASLRLFKQRPARDTNTFGIIIRDKSNPKGGGGKKGLVIRDASIIRDKSGKWKLP